MLLAWKGSTDGIAEGLWNAATNKESGCVSINVRRLNRDVINVNWTEKGIVDSKKSTRFFC